MFGRLLPRETSFFDFFEQHVAISIQGAREFEALVSEGGNTPGRHKRILELEHEADVVTHNCVAALHKTFITPIDRDDIHRLITTMDDIMDSLEAAADRMTLYEVKTIHPEAKAFANLLVKAAEELERGLKAMRDSKATDVVFQTCVNVNRLENEADALLRQVLARLFKEEADPLEVIKWKEIFENLENAADVCEDVANLIEGVVLEAT